MNPIVLDEADVVLERIDADRREAPEIEILEVGRARLEDHLILAILAQPVGVFAIAPVGRPPRRLNIGRAPRLGPERAQHGRGMKGARAHFEVVGLEQHATVPAPIMVQREDEVLETQHRNRAFAHPCSRGKVSGLHDNL